MKQINQKYKKEELTGLRNPADDEIEKVSCHTAEECGRECQFFTSIRFFLDMIAVPFIISFFLFLYQRKQPVGEAILELILGIVLLFCALKSKKHVTTLRKLLTVIKNGDFQVIDCYSTELRIAHGEGADVGIAYLETIHGQTCSDKFIFSKKNASDNQNRTKIPLLLIVQKEFAYYEVMAKENEKHL